MINYSTKHKCDNVCSLCTSTPPCTKDQAKFCSTYNRRSFSEKCFQNQLTLKVKGRLICQLRKLCRNCWYPITNDSKHECFVIFVIRRKLQATFARRIRLSVTSGRTRFCTFSSTRSAKKTFNSMMGLLSIYRILYVLSICFLNVKRKMI